MAPTLQYVAFCGAKIEKARMTNPARHHSKPASSNRGMSLAVLGMSVGVSAGMVLDRPDVTPGSTADGFPVLRGVGRGCSAASLIARINSKARAVG